MTKEEVLEAIKQMSVLELSELVKELESEFGVSAAAPDGYFGHVLSYDRDVGRPAATQSW